MKFLKDRRQKIAKALPKNKALVLSSSPQVFRQVDVLYPYRQESHFYYLTGFEQEESLFILLPSSKSILFIKDRNPKKEAWDGPLYSSFEVKRKYGIDEVYTLSQLPALLSKKLKGMSQILYSPQNSYFDKKVRALKIKTGSAYDFLKAFRRIKSKQEIASIKKACAFSIEAHKEVAKALKANKTERALHAVFIRSIMEQGAVREAYSGIFACGKNATVLHYVKNNSICKKGELLLVDAGAEFNYYASDITRVYPVSGRFSKNQKKLYQALLKLQKSLIKEVRPKVSLKDINFKMFEGVTEILLEFGFLKGSLKENLKKQSYRKYCPHSVGHLLGLDVHDVSFKKTESSLLKEDMVLTIEPGIYISKEDKKAPSDLRGLGLRIEDDIRVIKAGRENLTAKLPKEIEEIEGLCSLTK